VLDSALPSTIVNLTMQDGTSGSPVSLTVSDGDGNVNERLVVVTGTFKVQERSGQSGAYIQINPDGGTDELAVYGTIQVIGGSSTSVTLEVKGGTVISETP